MHYIGKRLVGLSLAGIPKEVCYIAWRKGGLACGYSCTPLQGLIYSNSLVLGYGHAWLGRARIRLYILIKLESGWYEWVIRAIVVVAMVSHFQDVIYVYLQ